MINFTFAICHGHSMGIPRAQKSPHVERIIESIRSQNISSDKYEILIIGDPNQINMNFSGHDIRTIYFDDSLRDGRWLTRKKNILASESQYENLVFIHNYVIFNEGWYEGFNRFGNDFSVCVTPVFNFDGTKNYSWILNPYFEESRKSLLGDRSRYNEYLIPHNVKNLSKIQYIPGNYWIAKRKTMKDFPLDERILQSESEDCEWSMRVSTKNNFSLNLNSSVSFLRQDRKPRRPRDVLGNDVVDFLASLSDKDIDKYHSLQRETYRGKWLNGKTFLDEMIE